MDWPRLRKEAFARAARAEITVDTYDAIRFALGSLELLPRARDDIK
jgi:hypothetical protein